MKKILFSIVLIFVLIIDVRAEEKYNFSRIALEKTFGIYDAIMLDDKFYLMGEQYTCTINGKQDDSCNLYFVNDNNEIEKANSRFYFTGEEPQVIQNYLVTRKNPAGSYELYSCRLLKENCSLVENIDVSALYSSSEKYYYIEDDIEHEVQYYIVKNKDNKLAIYDGKGKNHLDFGDYKIIGEENFSEDGINAELEMLILKDNSNGSYVFIGEDDKVVTLTKEIADKSGINDENVLTVSHEIDKYYRFGEGSTVNFFTLTDGLINNIKSWDGHPEITIYNNEYVIENYQIQDGNFDTYKLQTLNGDEITKKYHHIYYFDDKKEIILANDELDGVIGTGKFVRSVLDIYDGNKIVYSKKLTDGDYIDEVFVDKKEIIWLMTNDEKKQSNAIYILRPISAEKEPAAEEDNYSYTFVNGMNNTFKIDSTHFVAFKVDGDFKLFKEIYIDGKLLDVKNYTVKESSREITFDNDYARKLSDKKEHTIKVIFTNGKEVSTMFKAEENIPNPHTGQTMSILFVVGLLGIALFIKYKRKTDVLKKI